MKAAFRSPSFLFARARLIEICAAGRAAAAPHKTASRPHRRVHTAPLAMSAQQQQAGGAGVRSALDEVAAAGGAFERRASTFRHAVAPGGRFEPEAGRYHLYVSLACPWANRCLAALSLKGLAGCIGVSVVHPTWQRTRPGDASDAHCGWVFRSPGDPPLATAAGHGAVPCDAALVPDAANGCGSVRELYELSARGGDGGGKYTVPVLWDTRERVIVNNESQDIVRMLNSAFNAFAANPGLDLYPEPLRREIDAVNEWVYADINDGVYKCGFARAQAAYDAAYAALFAALDRAEKMLAASDFLVGNALTEADVRLFMTLIRFDAVYVVYFKTNRNFIREMPALRRFVRRLWAVPELRATVNMDHIKAHYFTSHPVLNAYGVIPAGPEPWWAAPEGGDAPPVM